MTIFSSTPTQDKLMIYNTILDQLSQAKTMARKNKLPSCVLDSLENTTAIVYYQMKMLEATYSTLNTEAINDR